MEDRGRQQGHVASGRHQPAAQVKLIGGDRGAWRRLFAWKRSAASAAGRCPLRHIHCASPGRPTVTRAPCPMVGGGDHHLIVEHVSAVRSPGEVDRNALIIISTPPAHSPMQLLDYGLRDVFATMLGRVPQARLDCWNSPVGICLGAARSSSAFRDGEVFQFDAPLDLKIANTPDFTQRDAVERLASLARRDPAAHAEARAGCSLSRLSEQTAGLRYRQRRRARL